MPSLINPGIDAMRHAALNRGAASGMDFTNFDAVHEKMQTSANEGGHRDDARAAVRDSAEKLISSAMLIPFLASVRESSFGEGPFAPNIVERRFGPVIDQQVADQIMQSTNFNLVDSIVERYASAASQQRVGVVDAVTNAVKEWTA